MASPDRQVLRSYCLMIKGQKAWIRVRGAPNDPESFSLATWNGIAWEIPRVNSLGDIISIAIPDYMVIESFPPSSTPEELYKKSNKPGE